MSGNNVNLTVAGLEVSTNAEPNLVTPAWFAEALLVGQYWQDSGLLSCLQQQVRVHRGRMGKYEVCDFVLLLLAYAVSGLDSLQLFFEQLARISSVLMAVWGRQQCPVASTLSRFLADIDSEAVEVLRQLFEADLLEHGLSLETGVGIIDRMEHRRIVFDIDGTTQVVRHRVLPTQATHPKLKRRSEAACAPGYRGSKRGDVVRTRTAIEQAHTREWLGTFAGAGNGTAKEDLKRACALIRQYLQQHHLPPEDAIVRLDGLYGSAGYLSILETAQLGYTVRCRDYALLKNASVKAQLAQPPHQQFIHPDSPQVVRELFEVDGLDELRRGYIKPIRLIIMRMERFDKRKRSVGKCTEKHIHELFFTSLPADSFTAADVISLYNGRGGFEQTLSEEDREQDCDRWCSWQPEGQSFWQILSQWVWNWRTRVGWQQQDQPAVRQTVWSPALEITKSSETRTQADPMPQPKKPPEVAPQYGPMVVSNTWALTHHKLAGDHFTIIDDQAVECPAGHRMTRREFRYNSVGDMQMPFSQKAETCRHCSLRKRCVADGSNLTNGRRISVFRHKLPEPIADASTSVDRLIFKAAARKIPGTQAILWIDIPATQLRREVYRHLQQHNVIIESMQHTIDDRSQVPQLLTRHQRAHRRLSWEHRLKRNQLKSKTVNWSVQLFGISPGLAQFLKQSQNQRSETS